VTAIPPPLHAPSKIGKTAAAVPPEPQLRLDQIEITGDEPMKPTEQPEHGTYFAVSRGVLRVNEDGAHTCSGKWGITREQYNNGHTSNFTFRLEPHFAAQSAGDMKKANGETDEVTNEDSADPTSVSLSAAPLGSNTFPVDSAMYKGSFQMKRGATKYTSVIDHQIVLKFRKNTQGAYNVYGKGINSIGIFNLMGTLILSGKGSGHVELYRMYPVVSKPEQVPAQGTQQGNAVGTGGKFSAVNKPKLPTSNHRADNAKVLPGGSSMVDSDPTPVPLAVSRPVSLPGPVPILSGPAMPGGLRRESSRLVKLPSRLEDDDPHAQIGRMMAKCAEIIKFVSEKDNSTGKFFSEPVDPVAHGIPTYYQIINEPMDLGTIQRKMDANEILTPEEFGRLVRLVFENAMTFNVEPTHVVHQAGRNLLILFNQKFRDVERSIENIRKTHKMSDLEVQRLSTGNSGHPSKEKGDKTAWKKKRSSPKQQLLVDAQAMATANAASLTALLAAAPPDSSPSGHVTRSEFTVMMQMIQQLQEQVLKTLTAVADLSSDQIDETSVAPPIVSTPMHVASHANPIDSFTSPPMTTMLVTEKKKHVSKPKKEECVIEEIPTDEDKPLTLKEQKILTETINALDPSNFPGVIQIIRESADLDDDEEEIDLEIDQLDTVTQRKLQKYVMKHVKSAKKPKTKAVPKKKVPNTKKTEMKLPATKKPKLSPPPESKSDPSSFFSFGNKDDSDSDSEGEVKAKEELTAAPTSKDNFELGGGFGEAAEDDEDDDENGGLEANWSMAKPSNTTAVMDDGEDDADDWGAAREEAAAAKEREAERKAREEKIRTEAEQERNQRLAEAAARGEEILAQRKEEEENAAVLRLQKGKEAELKKKKAQDATRAELQKVKQTVDLDAQRDIMKQYENFGMDGDIADGSSPASDFGF